MFALWPIYQCALGLGRVASTADDSLCSLCPSVLVERVQRVVSPHFREEYVPFL